MSALPIAPLIVLPAERHLAIVTGEQPPIGDGHAMGIAGEVVQHRLRAGQRGLRVDHPLRLPQGRQRTGARPAGTPALALPLQAEALLGRCLAAGP